MELGWWDLTKEFKASDIEPYLNGFGASFGVTEMVKVTLAAVPGKQKLEFFGGYDQTKLSVEVELHVKNPLNEEMDVAVLVFSINTEIEIGVTEEFSIVGKILNVDTEVVDFQRFFFTRTTMQGIQKEMVFVEKALQSYLNVILAKGIDIPIPDWIFHTMTVPRVGVYPGYIIFDSDPAPLDHPFLQ